MGLCAAASVCERKAPSDEWSIRMSKYNQFLHRPCIPWPCNHQGFTHKSTSRLSSSLFNELHSLEQFPDAKLNEKESDDRTVYSVMTVICLGTIVNEQS